MQPQYNLSCSFMLISAVPLCAEKAQHSQYYVLVWGWLDCFHHFQLFIINYCTRRNWQWCAWYRSSGSTLPFAHGHNCYPAPWQCSRWGLWLLVNKSRCFLYIVYSCCLKIFLLVQHLRYSLYFSEVIEKNWMTQCWLRGPPLICSTCLLHVNQ